MGGLVRHYDSLLVAATMGGHGISKPHFVTLAHSLATQF
jgi:hypothetical protein